MWAGSRLARSKRSRSVAVERDPPAAGSAGNWNGATGLPPAGMASGQSGGLLAGEGDHGVAHAQRQADPLAHQGLVGLAGRAGQRLA
jgi:hypothetical protein